MRVRPSLPLWTLLIALLATFSSSVWATERDVQGGSEQVFRAEELDQMLAPLALYPDTLLAQVLMASTYPGDVADAASWSMEHPDASGDDAVRQVSEQPWDPSVQSLVAFPAVLATLGQDPAWVQRVGDAFLAQPDAVMDSVQRLRHQAREAGNLESNDKQKVSELPAETTQVSTSSGQQTIIIEPADPQVVYVPSYNPTVVYGTWPYPSYPPVYYPPPPGYYFGGALMAGLRDLVPAMEFRGVGGPAMQAQGLESRFPMEELAVMGIWEVLPKYRALKARIAETARAVALAEARYRAGLESRLELLDAQRQAYAARQGLLSLQRLAFKSTLSLYKALGGGLRETAAEAT
mgnify:CR=1 FL=1